jgi:hypothetical protein
MPINFPDAPTTGQVFQGWKWDSTKWVAATVSGDITGVAAGAGLTGGGTSGDVTLSLTSPVSIANGGTNATSAANALINLGAAPLASPALTGNPTAPTPTAGDNDTSLATTAFVTAAMAAAGAGDITGVAAGAGLTGGGTSGDVSLALSVPVSIANGGTNAITAGAALTSLGAAPIASPTFTGTPTLPTGTVAVTQAIANNTTAVATTAFVKAQGYLVGNQSITLSGDISGSGTTAITTTLATVPVAKGGTGATTAPTALTNLGAAPLASPSFTGNINVAGTATLGSDLFCGAGNFTFTIKTDGLQSHAGQGGAYQGNFFNFQWTGTPILWIDNVNVGTITVTCDYRIKESVADLPSMWDRIKALRPISYTLKENPELLARADPAERWGFIAHEMQEALLESAATGYKDAPNLVQSPDLMALIAPLTKALQEAMARIEALEAGR